MIAKKNIGIFVRNIEGGVGRVVSELSHFLNRESANVYIFTENRKTNYSLGGKKIILRPKRNEASFFTEAALLLATAKEMKKKKQEYDIDISISFMEPYNLANILSRCKDKVIVRVCTTLSAREDMVGLAYNKYLICCLYNMADRVVVLSTYGKRDMIQNYGIRKEKLVIIPNSVFQRTFEDTKPWTYGDKVILAVARVQPVKQLEILVDVVEQLKKTIPDIKLVIVGNDTGAYAHLLKKQIKKKSLERYVIFTGLVDDVEYYMKHSQVLLSTSKTEGFPNSVLEAMNQGMPIIATDYPGPIRSILGATNGMGYGKYGILCPYMNEDIKDEKYGQALTYLCNYTQKILLDKHVAQVYGKASQERARFYSHERIEKMWKKILSDYRSE